jgi:hypothetical protein
MVGVNRGVSDSDRVSGDQQPFIYLNLSSATWVCVKYNWVVSIIWLLNVIAHLQRTLTGEYRCF